MGLGNLDLALISGTVCHSKQCMLADYYRNIHLFFLKGKSGSELDTFKQQRTLFIACRGKETFGGSHSFISMETILVSRNR